MSEMHEIDLKRLAENWFRPRLYERIDAFRKAGQTKLAEFVARGWMASPHMYGAVQILAGKEIEQRGSIIFEGYTKALTATAAAITPELQHEIQRDLKALIAAESEQVRQSIQYVADSCKPSMPKDAAALHAPIIAKIAADFDVLCATLNRKFGAPPAAVGCGKIRSKRPKLPARTEKQVYQEAGSRCVFCPERDVSSLQVHHIDSNAANNAFENLILACATCHTKITAGVIPESEVVTRKRQLRFEPQQADMQISKGNASLVVDRTVNTGTIAHTINKFEKGRTPRMHYPQGTIGSDAMRRNYIDYLITRYFECRKADASYGSRRPFAFPEIHRSIQKEFGAKTFFVLIDRFEELVTYLHHRIDRTILGRNKRSRGMRIYETFGEYQAEAMSQ